MAVHCRAMAVVAVAMLTGGLLLLQTLESALVSSTTACYGPKVQGRSGPDSRTDDAEEANRAVAGTVTKDPLVQILDKEGNCYRGVGSPGYRRLR